MRIHFIAIGGAIMHNLAICLHKKGHKVSGSDDIIFDPSKSNLEEHGLLPKTIGFSENNINKDIDAIILGMHARQDNVELKEAQKLGLKIYSFPEFIYEQSKDKKRVVIGGSHGKTTTTAMIMHVLQQYNIEFDYLVGAKIEGFEQSVALTDAPLILLEGDEYLSSPIEMTSKFHFYHPHITMITGIAWDHVNVFPTWKSYVDTFNTYIENLNDKAALIYFDQDKTLQELSEKATCDTIAYNTPNYTIENGMTTINHQGKETSLSIFGKHNLQNMEGARFVCEQLGISGDDFYQAISSFTGAARRLEKINTPKNVTAYKDFAHSPSKLQATINAVSEQFSDKNLIACMELHTFSSTDADFLSEFEGAMDKADIPIIYMSDKAFEIKRKTRIEDDTIWQNFNNKDITIIRKPENLIDFLKDFDTEKNVFLLMTSGNYDGVDWEDFFTKNK